MSSNNVMSQLFCLTLSVERKLTSLRRHWHFFLVPRCGKKAVNFSRFPRLEMPANVVEIADWDKPYDRIRNEREIYGLAIIQYSRMGFTNHSSHIDAIPLDAEMPLSRRTISSRNKQSLNSSNGYTSNNRYLRFLLSVFLMPFTQERFFLALLKIPIATVARRNQETDCRMA